MENILCFLYIQQIVNRVFNVVESLFDVLTESTSIPTVHTCAMFHSVGQVIHGPVSL